MDDRSASIVIDGERFELLLTTRATKEIGKRYGGMDKLGEKLMKAENYEAAIDEIVWLVTLLANQPIAVHNLKNPNNKRELLTEEAVELLTCPSEFVDYKEAIMAAMSNGTKRNVLSEDDTKNALGE